MKPIYLFKAFLFVCATLFLINIVELIQSNIYSFETFIQVALFSLALWLALTIRSPEKRLSPSPVSKHKLKSHYRISSHH